MKEIGVLMIGLGNVGQGFLKILQQDLTQLKKQNSVNISVVGISDIRYGNFYKQNGFTSTELLSALDSNDLTQFNKFKVEGSTEDWIRRSKADFLIEASFTNFTDAEPALSYMKAALESGKNIATSNKGPIALFYQDLKTIADMNGLHIGVEGTVMSGTPSMALGMHILKAAGITKIQGILNGTTNFILTQMETGKTYADALTQAKILGFAEADPTGDVEGFDAAGKVVILGNLVMGQPISFSDVDRKGISNITLQDVEHALEDNKRWKLIGTLELVDGKISASVKPMLLPTEHPLANVGGATNAITFTSRHMGNVTLIGAGAGRIETGYALLSDILAITKSN